MFLVSVFALKVKAEDSSSSHWNADKPDVLNLKIGYLGPTLNMDVRTGSSSSDPNDIPIHFQPSPLSKTFLGVSYRNLGATLSFSNRQSASDTDKYGSGTALDFQVSLYGVHLTQQYFYQTYDNYYISNTSKVDPSYPENQYIKRPDIKTQHYGANFIYNFQPERYSMAVAFDQSGRQTESGGAWLASVGIHNHRFSSNPQLIPTIVAPKFGELATLQQGDIFQLNISGGGGYTWVLGNDWYFSGQLLFGAGYAYQKFETAENYYTKSAINQAGAAMISYGYNGKNNYFFFQAGSDSYTYDLPSLKMQITSQSASLYYGHRFDEIDVPFLNKASGWLD